MFRKMNNEKGVALVLALMVLAALTMMGIAAIMTSTLDMQIAGNERTGIQAQYAAEAGIAEAIGRLNLPSPNNITTPATPAPPWPADWSRNTASNYRNWFSSFKGEIKSTDNKVFFNYSVRVSLKQLPTDSTKVAFYNQTSGYSKSPYVSGGQPVYYIESTGRSGNYRSAVVLELTKDVYNYNIQGGLSAKGPIKMGGSATIDGRQHPETATAAGQLGGSCSFNNLTGTQPAVYTSGTLQKVGGATSELPLNSSQTGAPYAPNYPWDALGLTQEQFNSAFTQQTMSYGGALVGQLHISGTGTYQVTNISGNGILVVHNPNYQPSLGCPACGSCSGSCAPALFRTAGGAAGGTYKGIIIADQVELRGGVTVVGAVVSLTTIETTELAFGNPQILYSCEAIEKYAGGKPKKKLAWTVKR